MVIRTTISISCLRKGVLLYEMLVGYPPFFDEDPFKIYEKIIMGDIDWPDHLDPVAKDLITKLLEPDRIQRLGNMENGVQDVKSHRWFIEIDWQDVLLRKLIPPIIPDVLYEGDSSNFHDYPESDWKSAVPIEDDQLKLFDDF